MRTSPLWLAGAAALAGCDSGDDRLPPPPPPPTAAQTEALADSLARQQIAQDQAELAQVLADLQQADPAVRDVYYSVNDAGERMINVVRDAEAAPGEEAPPPGATNTFAWMAGGMLLGTLLGGAMAAGGVNQFAQRQPPAQTHYAATAQQQRDFRAGGTNAYGRSVVNNSRVTAGRGLTAGAVGNVGLTRPGVGTSQGVFSSSQSNRSSSYGAGG